jgi:transcriptional regulator with GAF, ATPase, and Fis domain
MDQLDEYLKTLTSVRSRNLLRQRVRLQVITGPDTGMRIDFDGRARIGARPLADLVLHDPRVSGLHCEITSGGELRVKDLGSKNGTFLGPYRIHEAVLPPGESITVGETRIRAVPIDEIVDVPLHEQDHFHGIVGRSAMIRALTAQVERLAQTDTTILVEGETGVGKECVAEALHLAGPRASGPLVIVDCGSLPPNLIEAELFGHERGAFTGAVQRNAGAFERAHGGTIFLDEIGELPLELQPTLLRVLESRKVRRIGGDRSIGVNVRVVAATNRDLAVEVTRGRFREDLYYRLAVVRLSVPALRDRPEDVPLLAVHLLRQIGVDPAHHLTVESLQALSSHDWPGNVRELRNTLERAAALMEPVMPGPSEAPPQQQPERPAARPAPATVNLKEPMRIGKQRVIQEYERAYVTAILAECGGNVSEAARRSGMDRMSIHRILQRLGLRDTK